MLVRLEYYKRTGKWYSDGDYVTKLLHLHDICREVRLMRDGGILPGLMGGHSDFIVRVTVPRHRFNYPCLIL